MKNSTFQKASAMFAFLVATGGQVMAASPINNDPRIPAWRGEVGSTSQKWGYCCASNNPATPEQFSNPNGTPSAAFNRGTGGQGWVAYNAGWTNASDGGALYISNVWVIGSGAGFISNSIPQPTAQAPAYKYLQVQYTWYDASPSGNRPTNQIASDAVQVGGSEDILTGAGNSVGGTWKVTKSLWRMPSSRTMETNKFVATGTAKPFYIDSIIIDTVLVPLHTNIASVNPVVTWPALPASIVASESCTPSSGSTFATGETTVHCSLTDVYGATISDYTFTVTVTPSGPAVPTINCGADPAPVALGSACFTNLPDFRTAVTYTPMDGSVIIYQSPPPGTPVGPGVTMVTMKASNATDIATCMKHFTVTANAPVAVADPLGTVANLAKTIAAASLLGNDSSPDGRSMVVVAVSALSGGGGGGSVTLTSGNITYTPALNFVGQQTFYYTNQDCAGLASAGLVTVTVSHPTNVLTMVPPYEIRAGNVATVYAVGLPGVPYKLQKATVLLDGTPSSWTTLTNPQATAVADGTGRVTLQDTSSSQANAFYRAAYLP